MKLNAFRFVAIGMSLLVLNSCDKDSEGSSTDSNPKITLVSPTADVNEGDPIQVELRFTDDNGLKEVEIRLGNISTPNDIYDVVQRGLSGTSDELTYTVTPPQGLSVVGTNYIFVKCTDIDGNETILDRDFNIVDQTPPEVNITWVDNFDVFPGGNGGLKVDYTIEDDGGVNYAALELWETNQDGSMLITQLDIDEETYASPRTVLFSRSAQVSTNWVFGKYYKVIAKAKDVTGQEASEEINFSF